MSRTATKKEGACAQLSEACARNISAELHYLPVGGAVVIGSVRLFEINDKHVLADLPSYLDSNQEIPLGRPIVVHFSLSGTRYQFASTIQSMTAFVKLQGSQKIRCIALRQPQEVVSSQRRSNFRLSVAGLDPISVDLVRVHPKIDGACRLQEKVSSGTMVNLSTGGVAILTSQGELPDAKAGARFFLTFSLPGVEVEMLMLAVIRHVRKIESSDSLRLGIAFRKWNEDSLVRSQRVIDRFIAEYERRLLRRRS